MRDTKPVQPGHNVRLTLDAQPAGPGRAGARRGRQDVAAEGRDRDRDGPQQRRDPRARQLAAGERQRARRGARLRAPEPRRRRRPTSRARPSRRSPSPPRSRTARSRRTRRSTSRRCCTFADREIKDAEDHGYETDARSDILKYSSNIGAVLIAQQRRDAAPFDAWIHRSGFGKPTGVDLPGEERGHRAAARAATPARRWATCRSARASRSRRCRWPPPTPRSPTAASCARRTSSPSVGGKQDQAAGRQARDLRGHRGLGAQDARGRARPGRHRLRRRDRGLRRSPARPARPRRRSTASTPRTSTSRRSSASRPPSTRSCSSR